MNEIANHAGHLMQFDSALHWCFLIALFGFVVGGAWVVVRILIPLRHLARQASGVMQGELPRFDRRIGGIGEIEQMRRSLNHMMGQIQAAQERELTYRNALTESQENERRRVARDIHDDTIQSLVLVSHHLELAARAAKAANQPGADHLDDARTQVVQTIEGLRQIIGDLRPSMLEELGLADALESLCDRHPKLRFAVQGDVCDIAPAQELALFRAAQEAIYNAEHHAQARQINARLIYAGSAVSLEVCDDGIGFAIPHHLQEFAVRGHYGLLGIRERIQHLGGQLQLFSAPAAGTRLMVTVPLSQKALAAA
ncbi:MAG: sensor histidine kinase [Anaerolineae bacterium]|nr:sensor histidine kinase [Anaerolineae bacterium]